MTVSYKPSDAKEGGLLNDVNVQWNKCSFTLYDYRGTVAAGVPTFTIEMEDLDTGAVYDSEFWSVGSGKDWQPNEEGSALVEVGGAEELPAGSNFMELMESLVDCGFDEDKFEDKITFLNGLECHMQRVDAPERAGLVKTPRADGKEFKDTILIVSDISKMPWEKAKKKKTGAGGTKSTKTTKTKDKAKAEETETVEWPSSPEEAATSLINEVLAERGGGPVPKKDFPGAAFTKYGKWKDCGLVISLVFADDFLKKGPWTLEEGMVSFGE